MNYYGSLVVIAILGLSSVLLARYDYQHPTSAASGVEPTIGTTWYSVVSFDICGTSGSLLPAQVKPTGGFAVGPNDVIRISPVSAADAGNHATVSQFADEYPGFIASSSELAIPIKSSLTTAATTYHNGELCPASSKYPKQAGEIQYAYWRSFGQKTPTVTTNPSSIKFSNQMELTVAFIPKGATPPRPSTAGVNEMVMSNAQNANTTTTTTLVPATTTTLANTTTTTVKK